MPIVHPTLLAALTPAAAAADLIDADVQTNLGNAVTINANGTYSIAGDSAAPGEYFNVRLFDDSTGDWHAQSPFKVFIGGTLRIPNISGTQAAIQATLASLGISSTVSVSYSDSAAEGDVFAASVAQNDLVVVGQVVMLYVAANGPLRVAQQLHKLSPRGALATSLASGLRRFYLGIADELARVYARVYDFLREIHPSTTHELLSDFEFEYGLPDPCVTAPQTEFERQQAVLSRIASVGGQSRAYYMAVAAGFGISIGIVEERPFEVGLSGMGDGIGGGNYAFTWSVIAPVGTTTAQRQLLECTFERIKPAYTDVVFFYQ